jgi:PAS domain S-box-containing protein
MLHLTVRPRSVYRPMLDSQDDFRALFENAPDALFTHDLQSRITRVNSAFERLTGYTRPAVIGMNLADVIVPEHRSRFQQSVLERLGGPRSEPLEVDLITAANERIALEITTDLIFASGTPVGIQCFARNITDRRREIEALAAAKAELTEKTRQLAAFARHLGVLHKLSSTAYSGIDTLFSDYLSAGCEIFGVPSGAISQLTADGLVPRCVHGPFSADPAAERVGRDKETVQLWDAASAPYIGTPLFVRDELFGTGCRVIPTRAKLWS